MLFAMSLRLSDLKVLHNIASSSSFFSISVECKEFNKTIIQFALVGYETGYSELGATRYLPSHIQRALME